MSARRCGGRLNPRHRALATTRGAPAKWPGSPEPSRGSPSLGRTDLRGGRSALARDDRDGPILMQQRLNLTEYVTRGSNRGRALSRTLGAAALSAAALASASAHAAPM